MGEWAEKFARPVAVAGALLLTAGCVSFPPAPESRMAARIEDGRLFTRDGAALGLDVWRAENPKAVLIALHGMNDYARAFEGAAEWWSAHGVTVYAYDQRGFGRSPQFGRWPGEETLIADLRSAIAAVRADNPGAPVYVLGHSMGAAVMMAAADDASLDVDGVILAAPGVWGGGRLPIFYRMTLNLAAGIAPGKTLTGERAERQATDNIAILREMLADPLVIKPTRLDAVLGVVRLMGGAWDASDEIGGRILFLYGERDEIIPVEAMKKTAERLCGDIDVRGYAQGWHLLFRDLQAERVWRDVVEWVLANSRDGEVMEAERRRQAALDAAGRISRFGPAASHCVGADRKGRRANAVRKTAPAGAG